MKNKKQYIPTEKEQRIAAEIICELSFCSNMKEI